MRITNVRLGHACNSSSTHTLLIGREVEGNATRGDYGWSHFVLSNGADKMDYLGNALCQHLRGVIGEDMTAVVLKSLFGGDVTDGKNGYGIDHQSVPALPMEWGRKGVDKKFLDAFMAFLSRSDVAILGGNDNGEWEHKDIKESEAVAYPFRESTGTLVAREDNGLWTLFSPESGTRVSIDFSARSSSSFLRKKPWDGQIINFPWLVDPQLHHSQRSLPEETQATPQRDRGGHRSFRGQPRPGQVTEEAERGRQGTAPTSRPGHRRHGEGPPGDQGGVGKLLAGRPRHAARVQDHGQRVSRLPAAPGRVEARQGRPSPVRETEGLVEVSVRRGYGVPVDVQGRQAPQRSGPRDVGHRGGTDQLLHRRGERLHGEEQLRAPPPGETQHGVHAGGGRNRGVEEGAGHMTDLDPALLLSMMLHATGDMKSKHRSKIPWRNFYVANTNSLESEGWLFLAGLGLAMRHRSSPITGGEHTILFSVSPAGVAFLKAHVKSQGRRTKKQPSV